MSQKLCCATLALLCCFSTNLIAQQPEKIITPNAMVVFSDSLSDSGNTYELLSTLNGQGDSDFLIYPLLVAGEGVWGKFFNDGVKFLGKMLAKFTASLGVLPTIPQAPYWQHHFSDGKTWNEYYGEYQGFTEYAVRDMESESYQQTYPNTYVDVSGQNLNRSFGGSWSTTTLKHFNWLHPIESIKQLIQGKIIPPSFGLIVNAYLDEMKHAYPNQAPMLDSQSLYTVFYGGNDYLNAKTYIDFEKLGQSDAEQRKIMHEYVQHVIDSIEQTIAALSAKGAKHYLLINMPDFTLAPRFMDSASIHAGMQEMLNYHNQLLAQLRIKLDNKPQTATLFNLHQAFSEMIDELAAEGKDVTHSCLKDGVADEDEVAEHPGLRKAQQEAMNLFSQNVVLQEAVARQVRFAYSKKAMSLLDNQQCETTNRPYAEHMFWDTVHPTTVTHQRIAQRLCRNQHIVGPKIQCSA